MPSAASSKKRSGLLQEALLRANRENLLPGLLEGKTPEPTLEEARADLAAAISRIAHSLFADRFGPLVGTVTETSVNAGLKSFEEQLHRAKGDFTLVAQELSDRIFTSVTSKKK